MISSRQNTQSEKNQFRLAKHFAYTSFIVLLIFSFPFSMVISRKAKDVLMRNHENYALLLGENLNHQVFQNFVLPVTMRFGKIRLREKKQSEWMDKIVKSTIHSFNIDMVNIYDTHKGVIAYSTNPELLGKKVKKSQGYQRAVKGENSSHFITGGNDLWGLGIEVKEGEKKLRTYIPLRGFNPFSGKKEYILGVFELIQNLTKEYHSIVKFQYLIVGLSILIMGLIFLALILVVHKAEIIINKQAKEQREFEAQLNQAEHFAALGQMCAGVSHEIRNPLGIIRSTAELMSDISQTNETRARLSGVIVEESNRLNNIITQFLDFAHPHEPVFEDCYLEQILEKNLLLLRPELDKGNISINNNINGRSFKLKADAEMLFRAFLNIFLNAIQSMEKGGSMNLCIREEKDHYEIDITDTGCGINKKDLNNIFNPFFTTKVRGSGLGLSIVKNIIEGHNGSIHIETKDGEGTKVTIDLPHQNMKEP
ncbi:MAG: hypothetical protein B1H11_01060 [Desulfobacteraceae bacterium 4484_190.1]|nr:MAG: hypothetical protein B1H11_01060 [Desulfobacteraceae bacterium 4484_190.1]